MLYLRSVFYAAALSLVLPVVAQAATVTQDYGNGVGEFDPVGNDRLRSDFVVIKDSSSSPFEGSFDLASHNMSVISRISLTLNFTHTTKPGPNESWSVRVLGDDPSATNDDLFLQLRGSRNNNAIVFDSTTNAALFSSITNAGQLSFGFVETSDGVDSFRLFSATLGVEGTPAASNASPVPLPASGLMLIGALAGAGALRRRKTRS